MTRRENRQISIGTALVDGDEIEFVWAPGTQFVTCQFTSKTMSPRGLANLTRLDTRTPSVVPLSHRAWLAAGDREAVLIEYGRSCFEKALQEHGFDEDRGSPVGRRRPASFDERNDRAAAGLFNRAREQVRTR